MKDRDKYKMTLQRQRTDRELVSKKPVPYRITTALDMWGLFGPEVDRELGGEEPMVDLWESGDLVPTREQIDALAELTQYPVKFFYAPVTRSGGYGWLCGSGGCERVWFGPPALPDYVAEVVPISARLGPSGTTTRDHPKEH